VSLGFKFGVDIVNENWIYALFLLVFKALGIITPL
jgi:hypothetical protein